MSGPPPMKKPVYGDVQRLAQLGIKNSVREYAPRVVDRKGGRPRTRVSQARLQGRRANLPQNLDPALAAKVQALARASRNLAIVQQAVRDNPGEPVVKDLLRQAERQYVRSLYDIHASTGNLSDDYPDEEL